MEDLRSRRPSPLAGAGSGCGRTHSPAPRQPHRSTTTRSPRLTNGAAESRPLLEHQLTAITEGHDLGLTVWPPA